VISKENGPELISYLSKLENHYSIKMTQLHQQLDLSRLPRHVAIIMDGNGRWAQHKGYSRIRGHQAGAESVREVVRVAREVGLPYLTLYAFSEENWQRPQIEVQALMQLLSRYLQKEVAEMRAKQIAFQAIGDLSQLPRKVQRHLTEASAATAAGAVMTLTLALSYGSRSEIVQAARRLAEQVHQGELKPQDITHELFSQHLYTKDMPDPDLLIRTSGEYRISNFLLWQLAYTELYFTETLWPDFREEEFLSALVSYQGRDRRFGLTQEQIEVQA
jgi:undecaprenyl diphosphate synthase